MPGAPHIVVCDDEPDIRGPIGEYLMMRGFRVSEAMAPRRYAD
jgi:hypothetical protein